jgi:eukaryotic-like serine/threonine-protein kinase
VHAVSLPQGARLGSYEIATPLGVGGMGEVYRATDSKLGRDVAIKVLPAAFAADAERLARFEREAKLLASLNHPNIAHVYGFESAPLPEGASIHFLAMELVEGEDLAERLKRGAIPGDESLAIAKQIAEGLEEAHEKSIIHRDLKPANVKLTLDGKVKVLDFGLAKALAADAASGSSADLSQSPTLARTGTQAGIILGTAAYMSPEQARGKPVDKRADIWAFGVVLYEMLTGTRLFAGETVSDVLAGVLKSEIDLEALPHATPPGIRQLLTRCLAREPRSRLRDIGDARIALEEALAGEVDESGAPGSLRAGRAKRVLWALATLALVFAVLFVASRFRSPAGPAFAPRVIRFPLASDPSLFVATDLTTPFAISPDGQTVVFTGTRGGAKPHLWVRSLDSPDARELEDTESATQPAISPDGKWVAFLSRFNEVRKVRLSGGASTRLWSMATYSAALTWASDDEILLEVLGATAGSAGIHRLSAGGGAPQELVPLDAAVGETTQRRPFVLRRDRMLLYASTTSDVRTTLAMYSLADGRRSRLGIEGVQALGMVDGRLVYARADGNLMAVPLDVAAMRVTGAVRELRERVATSGIGTRVALSEAGTLVYRSGSSTSRLMLLDENGRSQPLGTELGDFALPRFSPDGRRIVVGTGGDRWDSSRGVARDLWLFDRGSGQATRLTRSGTASAPGWTPDGRRVVYVQAGPRKERGEVWTLPLDGSAEASRLAVVGGSLGWPAASPDGRSLIAVETSSATPAQLIRVSLEGSSQVTPLFPASSQDALRWPQQPRVSPDGRLVAFSDSWEVYVRPLDGAGTLQVTDSGGSSPAWAPDSRHLYFGNGNVLAVAEIRTTPTLAVVGRRVVTQLQYSCEDFDLAPDGKSFVVVVPASGRSDVLVAAHWTDELRRSWRQGAPGEDAP